MNKAFKFISIFSIFLLIPFGVARASIENPADIVAVSDTIFLDADAEFVELTLIPNDVNEVEFAIVEIRRPDIVLGEDTNGTQPVTNYEVFYMLRPGSPKNPYGDRFYLKYDEIRATGAYEFFYTVYDQQTKEPSVQYRSVAYKNKASNQAPYPFDLVSPENGEQTPTSTIFDWTDTSDPNGDFVSYTLEIADDESFTTFNGQPGTYKQEELQSSKAVVDAEAQLLDYHNFVWRVIAIDGYGQKRFSNQRWHFTTNNNNAPFGIVEGIVFNTTNFNGVANAILEVTVGVVQETFTTEADGSFILKMPSGLAKIKARANGYDPKDVDNVDVKISTRFKPRQKLNIGLISEGAEADVTPPELTLLGSPQMQVFKDQPFKDPGATATDNVDGNVTDAIIVSGEVDTKSLGNYSLSYTVIDAAGNASDAVIRQVEVVLEVLDRDSDGVNDVDDAFPDDPNESKDSDGDGLGDNYENEQGYNPFSSDSDGDGVNDYQEELKGTDPRAPDLPDTTAPVITLKGPAQLILAQGGTYKEAGATALDDKDGDITSQIIRSGDVIPDLVGTYEITFNVSDRSGNAASEVLRSVVVQDQTPPVIKLNGYTALTLYEGQPYVEFGAVASDNNDGDISSQITINGTVNNAIAGTYTVEYSVTDSAENTASESRTIYVITQVIDTDGDGIVDASDDFPNDPKETRDSDGDGLGDNFEKQYPLDPLKADTDGDGINDGDELDQGTDPLVDNNLDVTAPVIILNGEVSVNIDYNTEYIELGAAAQDDRDGDISNQVVIQGSVNTQQPGIYTLTYSVVDSSDNKAKPIYRYVTVGDIPPDEIPPVIYLNGQSASTLIQGEAYVELGAKAIDDRDGDITSSIIISGSVDTGSPKTYVLSYSVSDSSGNPAASIERRIRVIDVTPPILSLVGANAVTVVEGDSYVDDGAVAIDNSDGDISDSIQVTGNIDTGRVGEYVLTFNVSDLAGNAATSIQRSVVVEARIIDTDKDGVADEIDAFPNDPSETKDSDGDGVGDNFETQNGMDIFSSDTDGDGLSDFDELAIGNDPTDPSDVDNTPPEIKLVGASVISLIQGDDYVEYGAVALDDNDGDLTGKIAISGSVNTNLLGEYVITYTVEDARGNRAQATRQITVGELPPDIKAPFITLLGNSPILMAQGTAYREPGIELIDDRDGDISHAIVVSGTVNTQVPGRYTLSYQGQDSAGNVSPIVTRIVDVIDVTKPVLTLIGPSVQSMLLGDIYTEQGATANDNTDGNIDGDVQITGTVDTSKLGTYLLTYSVVDAAGNASLPVTRQINVLGELIDSDGDSVEDSVDAFPSLQSDSIDSDQDRLGDNFEKSLGLNINNPDTDGDGMSDYDEFYLGYDPLLADADLDGDGLLNIEDNCETVANSNQLDTDGDGEGNACDLDDDNDGMSDDFEFINGLDSLDPADAALDKDADGVTNLLEFQAGTDIHVDDYPPVFVANATPNIEIAATGKYTHVLLNDVYADDGGDGKITATADLSMPLLAGKYDITWSATDEAGNVATQIQSLVIHPQVYIISAANVAEGDIVDLKIALSGAAQSYPVTIPLTYSGAATLLDDFSAPSEVQIDASGEASISIDTYGDFASEGDELIQVLLGTPDKSVSLSAYHEAYVTIIEEPVPPIVSLQVKQGDQATLTVTPTGGVVTVSSVVNDVNGTHSYDWALSDNRIQLNGSGANVTFDPASLIDDSYFLHVAVADSGFNGEIFERSLEIVVKPETVLDSDADGVSNTLDRFEEPHMLMLTKDKPMLAAIAEPGTRLVLGAIASQLNEGALNVANDVIQRVGVQDDTSRFNYGLLDLEATLPIPGAQLKLLLPYESSFTNVRDWRFFKNGEWQTFITDEHNSLKSAVKIDGACPAINSSSYTAGLNDGAQCLLVSIQDGSAHDPDGQVNGVVNVLGGVASNVSLSLSGQVNDWLGNSIKDLTVELTDLDGQVKGNSAVQIDGNFTLESDITEGAANYTFTKSSVIDAGTKPITSADALAALKIAVGINPNASGEVSPYQFFAADINNDGRVTSADALEILKVAVGLSSLPATPWVFVNTDTPLDNVNKGTVPNVSNILEIMLPAANNSKFVGILKGNVNGL